MEEEFPDEDISDLNEVDDDEEVEEYNYFEDDNDDELR